MIIHHDKNTSDDDFAKLLIPAEEELRKYEIKNAEEFIAKYISIYYENDVLFDDDCLDYAIGDAVGSFSNVGKKDLDINRIEKLLKEEYKLIITNYDPIDVERCKN